jgi:hypothetical protein
MMQDVMLRPSLLWRSEDGWLKKGATSTENDIWITAIRFNMPSGFTGDDRVYALKIENF